MCFFSKYEKVGFITVVNDGLFYYGPNTGIFGFNIFLIVLFTALAFGPGSPHPAASVIGVLFGLVCLYFLLRCGLSDPGIIPRREASSSGNNNGERIQPQHQEVMVECKNPQTGKMVPKSMELTWCYTCNIQRPLRASHCKFCDCCIERMDHHCPWTGTCIGARNYKFFFGFVNSVTFYCLYIISMMGYSMKLAIDYGKEKGLSGSDAFFEGMKHKYYYMPLVCLIVAIISLAMVGGLACYHCGLASGDLTTHEDMRRYYWMLNSPYDRGSCGKNCSGVLCSDQPPDMVERQRQEHQQQNNNNNNNQNQNQQGTADHVQLDVPPPSSQNQNQNQPRFSPMNNYQANNHHQTEQPQQLRY